MTILFPHTASRYFQLAQEALGNKKKEEGFYFLQQSYLLEKNFRINFILVNLAVELENYSIAYKLIQDYEELYLKDDTCFSVYLHCLLEEENFILAHQLVNQLIYQENQAQLKKNLRYKKVVRQKELLSSFQRQENLGEAFKEAIRKGNFHKEKTYFLLQALTQEEFIKSCKMLFMEEEVPYLAKSFLIEELIRLDYKEKMSILYLNKEVRTLLFQELFLINEEPLYEVLLSHIYRQSLKKDPLQLVNAMEEFRLLYSLLYPFEKYWITNPKAWVQAFIYRNFHEYPEDISAKEVEQMKEAYQLQEDILKKRQLFSAL